MALGSGHERGMLLLVGRGRILASKAAALPASIPEAAVPPTLWWKQCHEDLLLDCGADPVGVTQVLTNVIGNPCKFTEPCGHI